MKNSWTFGELSKAFRGHASNELDELMEVVICLVTSEGDVILELLKLLLEASSCVST